MPGTQPPTPSNPDLLTVLYSMNGRHCAKRWYRDAAGQIACEPYGHESHWVVGSANVGTLSLLAAALVELSRTSRAVVIRGELADPTAPMPEEGWLRQIHGPRAPFTTAPRRWVALDFDGIEVPEALAYAAPSAQVSWVVQQLPSEWHNISCVWQFTSSHGMGTNPRSLRLRLWFLTDVPLTDVAWRAYWRGRAEPLCLDLALFRAVQPHYVCAPVFDGVDDPVGPDRLGILQGDLGDYVPISLTVNEADRSLQQVGGLTCEELPPGLANRQQIEATLERIRRQETSGARHHHLLGACCELYALGCTLDTAFPVLEDLLRRQGREPAESEVRSAWEYARTRQAQGTLHTTNPPVATQFPPLAGPELPRNPDVEAITVQEANAVLIEAAEWSANDHLNARLYLRTRHPQDTLLRVGQTDYEWQNGAWTPMESDEVLLSRVIQHTGMKSSRCTATAASIRGLVSKERVYAPMWLSNRRDASQVVPFQNGVLDTAKWALNPADPEAFRPLTPDLFIHNVCPYSYDPNAACPTFDRFLMDAFPSDPTARRELLKMLGYLMTPDTRYQKMFILGGVPGSGKSTFANILRQLVGPASCTSPSLASLAGTHGAEPLLCKTVAIIAEANNGGDMKTVPMAAVDLIKRITGCDEIQVNPKYKSPRDAVLPLRFVFACNRLPHFIDPSGAMARRIHLFWFRQSFVGREDVSMPARLQAELPGIANRALQGLRFLMEDGGFRPVQSSADVLRHYVRQISPVAAFVDDCLELEATAEVRRQDLYIVYKAWCADGGRMPLGLDRLVAELIDAIPGVAELRPNRDGLRVRVISGVKLSAEGAATLQGASGL